MILYMQLPLRYFYTFSSLDGLLQEWAVGFRYGNFTLKLALGKKSLASRGPTALGRQAFLSRLIFGGEEISIPFIPFGNHIPYSREH